VLDDGNRQLSAAQKNQLRELLTANGRSYADPVYDENGQVDAAASRRVAFKFRLTDEQMIEQMQSILEGTGD
jgi:chemotaxis protein MotB